MSRDDRDIVDIPEVFRRAFEEEGWDENSGGGEGGPGGGRRPSGPPWWANRWLWIGFLILLLLGSFNWIVTTYTDWLWFNSLGYRSAWITQWSLRAISFIVFFVLALIVLLANWQIAFNAARKTVSASRIRILNIPGFRWLIRGAAFFMAFLFAGIGGAQWERFLLYFNRQPFGVDDPIFGLDLSFYLFELPVYRFVESWLVPLLIIALLGVFGLYALDNWPAVQRGQLQVQGLRPQNLPVLRRQVAVLGAFIFALWSVGYWLDVYELLYSPRGVAFGASYTDLQATMPALYGQLALMVVLALGAVINIFRLELRPLLIGGALWLVVTVAGAGIYPSLLQRYSVEPNELAREHPYIEHNIAFTQLAFGLDKIEVRPFGAVDELSAEDLADNETTLQNVRLWDYRPLQQTYAQLQELRPYYEFSSIDIDRYQVDGEMRQVMLAGRELNKENLPSPSWVNQKLEFTHGYGVVMNPVDQVSPEGRPEFFIKDLPPQSSIDLPVDRPEIYYGEMMDDSVFVGSGLDEFDYPVGNENAYSSYSGRGGVILENLLVRLAFAFRFGESNLLLSEYIDSETRVLMHRQIRDRVQQITPFLSLDSDPYLVVADGRLIWMLDAYTISNDFPYSTPTGQRQFNYIRNAVKITIDAYDGSVNYYLVDTEDPIILAYDQAFPDLFQPLAAMPAVLQEHIRYPEDLFIIQTRQYLKYHMTEVQVFYNQEDLWEIPQEIFDNAQQPIEPYYVILPLPGEEETEYLLIQPYSPSGKNNMVAWLAARNDPEHYGQLVVYELPKQELVFGPIQVEARVDQDPLISQQISLWNQRGSKVIRGNLLVIPMNQSFLYVEPLYLLSETSELPELKRVIVASGNRIAMRETLDEALIALIEEAPPVAEIDDAPVDEPPVDDDAGEIPATPVDATVEELIQSANEHFEAAQAAQRRGDWATYGRELEALEADLAQLAELIE